MSGSTSQTGQAGQTTTPLEASQPPGRLRLSEVRSIFRLVGEVRELGADPDRWRPHMVLALRRIVGCEIVVSSEVHFRKSGGARKDGGGGKDSRPGGMRLVDIGWISDAPGKVFKAHTEREGAQPEDFWLSAATETPTAPSATGPRNGQPPDAEPSGPPAGAGDAAAVPGGELVPVKPTLMVYGGRNFILSQYPLPHAGAVDQLGLHRAWGEPPFTATQHKLVRLLHVELGRLWRRDAIRRAKEPTAALPPRLQQTLEELLAGKSEKEIAGKLVLSRHTIHNYVKALHQRFGVSSRGELLARAGKERAVFTPQLSLELPRGK